jgi:hypothetical protein
MAMTEKFLSKLRRMVQDDIVVIKEAGITPDPLGTLLFWTNHDKICSILAAGENMYDKFQGLPVKGRAFIASFRRFVMGACEALYYRKTRDCGFFVDGITWADGDPKVIVTWEELLAEFMWGKNPEFVFRIERIHR